MVLSIIFGILKGIGILFLVLLFLVLAVVSMGMSGWLLYVAQKTIPMGTAYMIWTGIGGVGTVILGIVFFHDAVTFWRMFFLSLVFIGIVGLKMAH